MHFVVILEQYHWYQGAEDFLWGYDGKHDTSMQENKVGFEGFRNTSTIILDANFEILFKKEGIPIVSRYLHSIPWSRNLHKLYWASETMEFVIFFDVQHLYAFIYNWMHNAITHECVHEVSCLHYGSCFWMLKKWELKGKDEQFLLSRKDLNYFYLFCLRLIEQISQYLCERTLPEFQLIVKRDFS